MGGRSKKKRSSKKRQRHESVSSANEPAQQKQRQESTINKTADLLLRKKPKVASDGGEKTLSLASHLKRQRGTADSTPLPPEWSDQHLLRSKSFLTPEDGALFASCQKQCYLGFYWEPPDQLPPSLHSTFDESLDVIHEAGLFLYDAVQPGGKRVSRTFVTRTLLGNPGSTYRYLGLRLFSHPWSPVTPEGDVLVFDNNNAHLAVSTLEKLGYSHRCAEALLQIGRLNQSLVARTKRALSKEIAPHVAGGLVGSSEYSLTLINRMEPSSVKRDLKRENLYGMGKTSVSWHRDSGLMDFSSIAVYHSLRETQSHPRNESVVPWNVAVRVASDSVQTPPLCVPLPSGSLYYLLDDFNHKHEHAVLAGSNQLRYSSTHRVAREGRGTWQYIREKCNSILKCKSKQSLSGATLSAKRKQLVKKTRAQQQLLTEIEFEWLRQWHIQGALHASLHPYWHKPMEQLSLCFQELERLSVETIQLLGKVSNGKLSTATMKEDGDFPSESVVSEDLYDVMIENLEERMKLRDTWRERVKDPIYASMPADMRPTSSPVLDRDKHDETRNMPEDLRSVVLNLRKWRRMLVTRKDAAIKRDGKHPIAAAAMNANKRSDLTKKEKRKIASNWESMKTSLLKKDGKK